MELIKKNIHMNRMKGKMIHQITLEDDRILPERLPDIRNSITQWGQIQVDSAKVMAGKVTVTGKLNFKMMYHAQQGEDSIQRLDGNVEFMESINMEGLEEGDTVHIDFDIDDLNIQVVNPRKVSVKAIVTVTVLAERICDEALAVDLQESQVECVKENLELTQLVQRKKDLLRMKETVELSGGKMNVQEIIWHTAHLSGVQTKLQEDQIRISGEVILFVLYTSEEGPLQWMEANVPFRGELEVTGCMEDQIPCIDIKLASMDIEVQPNQDGEQRIFQIDGILNLDIRLYEEQQYTVLKDVYSKEKELIPIYQKAEYENLVMKNVSRCKISDRRKIRTESGSIMQICSCQGEIRLDEMTAAEDGILVEGVVEASILYVCSDDANPLCCSRESLPFSQKIEVGQMSGNCVFQIQSMIEQLHCMMVGSDEIEIKGALLLDCIVFDKITREMMTDIEEREYDMEVINRMPGIVGYIVQKGDTLWNIAKKFYTTVDSLKNINGLTSDELMPGQMLIAVKRGLAG